MKAKKSHGAGDGKISVSTTLTDAQVAEIDRLAASGGISRGAWAREAITAALTEGAIFGLTRISQGKAPAQPSQVGPIPQKQKHATG